MRVPTCLAPMVPSTVRSRCLASPKPFAVHSRSTRPTSRRYHPRFSGVASLLGSGIRPTAPPSSNRRRRRRSTRSSGKAAPRTTRSETRGSSRQRYVSLLLILDHSAYCTCNPQLHLCPRHHLYRRSTSTSSMRSSLSPRMRAARAATHPLPFQRPRLRKRSPQRGKSRTHNHHRRHRRHPIPRMGRASSHRSRSPSCAISSTQQASIVRVPRATVIASP